MEIGMSEPCPIDELDPKFERALGLADELVFVESQRVVEAAQRRNRRLSYADRSDLGRFDDADLGEAVFEPAGQVRRGHPAGAAATDDCNASNARGGYIIWIGIGRIAHDARTGWR